jgi:hypothetical protein
MFAQKSEYFCSSTSVAHCSEVCRLKLRERATGGKAQELKVPSTCEPTREKSKTGNKSNGAPKCYPPGHDSPAAAQNGVQPTAPLPLLTGPSSRHPHPPCSCAPHLRGRSFKTASRALNSYHLARCTPIAIARPASQSAPAQTDPISGQAIADPPPHAPLEAESVLPLSPPPLPLSSRAACPPPKPLSCPSAFRSRVRHAHRGPTPRERSTRSGQRALTMLECGSQLSAAPPPHQRRQGGRGCGGTSLARGPPRYPPREPRASFSPWPQSTAGPPAGGGFLLARPAGHQPLPGRLGRLPRRGATGAGRRAPGRRSPKPRAAPAWQPGRASGMDGAAQERRRRGTGAQAARRQAARRACGAARKRRGVQAARRPRSRAAPRLTQGGGP